MEHGLYGRSPTERVYIIWLVAFFMALAFSNRSDADDFVYTVRSDDTLSSIGRDVLLDSKSWADVANINSISKPYAIIPGQVLTIPHDWLTIVPARARVVKSSGKAQMSAVESGHVKPLKPGVALAAGDRINTNEKASATIGFDDGSKLTIAENSNLEIIEINRIGKSGYSQIVVNLIEGRGEADINPEGLANHTFDVHTPSATTSVRGTRFRINAQSDQTFSEVTEGRVFVVNRNGVIKLGEGYGVVTRKNNAPSQPQELLPPPDVSFLPDRISTLPYTIALPSNEGILGYRVQLARNNLFTILAYDSAASDQLLIDTDVPNGRYAVRVRAIDDKGLAGLDAMAEIEVDAHPLASRDVEPADGAVIYGSSLTARWQPGEGHKVRLDAGTDLLGEGSIATHSVETEAATGEATISGLAPGSYQWRLIASSATGRAGAPGEIHEVEIRSIPAAPTPIEFKLDFRRLAISWAKQPDNMRYRVEFSRDSEFKELIDSVLTDNTDYVITRPYPGNYFVRVASIDQHDYQGKWATLPIDVPVGMSWRVLLGGAALLLLVL
ncbi:MAG: hypothetical protein DHS20C01_09560 [marine bacterium B5-7]|nr:MAG: hypothetical protein DHS20C01_09560 [marine bacterium B5-7]